MFGRFLKNVVWERVGPQREAIVQEFLELHIIVQDGDSLFEACSVVLDLKHDFLAPQRSCFLACSDSD